MASISVKAAETAESYYEKNKEIVNDIMTKTKSLLPYPIEDDKMHATTVVGITNETGWGLFYSSRKSWFGEIVGPYPVRIHYPSTAAFIHAAKNDENSTDMGAIVYATGDTAYGCLISWSVNNKALILPVPHPPSINKVYVEAGKIEELAKWDDIKAKLEKSGSKSYYFDLETETEIFAEITSNGNYAQLTTICAKRHA